MNEYISKQDMLNAVETLDIIPSVDGMGIPTDTEDFRVQFLGTVLKVEPTDVAPVVHGRWIKEWWHSERIRKCSTCNVTQTVNVYEGEIKFIYCPYCGSKMDGKE